MFTSSLKNLILEYLKLNYNVFRLQTSYNQSKISNLVLGGVGLVGLDLSPLVHLLNFVQILDVVGQYVVDANRPDDAHNRRQHKHQTHLKVEVS